MSWKEAITDAHGLVDTGRLAVFVLMLIVLGAVPCVIILAWYKVDPQPVGVAIGAICGGFATALAALAAYIAMDKKPTAPLPPDAPPIVQPQPAPPEHPLG